MCCGSLHEEEEGMQIAFVNENSLLLRIKERVTV